MTFCKNSIRISCQIIFVNKHWPQSCLCPFKSGSGNSQIGAKSDSSDSQVNARSGHGSGQNKAKSDHGPSQVNAKPDCDSGQNNTRSDCGSGQINEDHQIEMVAGHVTGANNTLLVIGSFYRQPNRDPNHSRLLCDDIASIFRDIQKAPIWIAGDANLSNLHVDWNTDNITGNRYPKEINENVLQMKITQVSNKSVQKKAHNVWIRTYQINGQQSVISMSW